MLIIKLQGGLGNQMFQYAFYRSLLNNNAKIDITDCMHSGVRIDRLFDIDFKGQLADFDDYKRLRSSSFILLRNKLLLLLKNGVGGNWCKYGIHGPLDSIRFNNNWYKASNIILDGYWQSQKYFKNIQNDIKKIYIFPKITDKNNLEYQDLIKSDEYESVSIHIRRGDYLKFNIYQGACNEEYYKKAIKYINSKVKCTRFFVFSDDIDWCKTNLEIPNVVYVMGNSNEYSFIDMHLMSLCKHNIIANSSFSWWGAWLNNNPKKIVVGPKKWFNLNNAENNDVICDGWIGI